MLKKIIKAMSEGEKLNADLLYRLHKTPIQDKGVEMPNFRDFKPNFTHQADLLHLPTAKFGYKYLLIVVDDYSRKFIAEPLKYKTSYTTMQGFKKIYEKWKLPKLMELDAGTEFHGDVETYFKSNGVKVRYAMTNRHRQQGLVESRNSVIGKVLFYIMNLKEMKTKKTSVDWYRSKEEFEKLMELINNEIKYKPPTEDGPIKVTKNNRDLLTLGTKVLVSLDYPIDVAHEKRQDGKFRAGDIRWSKEPKEIEWIVLKPNQPPMYRVTGEKVLRTINQLQVIN